MSTEDEKARQYGWQTTTNQGQLNSQSQSAQAQLQAAYANQSGVRDRAAEAAAKVRARVTDLQAQRETLMKHASNCVREQDWHGAWDGHIGVAEIELEIKGLEFALSALGVG